MTRPTNAVDCDVCGASGKYPIHNARGKMVCEIECPVCCGFGHDFGEAAEVAAEVAAEKAASAEDAALRAKYAAALEEMRLAQ